MELATGLATELVVVLSIVGTVCYLFFGICMITIICDTAVFNTSDTGVGLIICILFFWPLFIPLYALDIWKNQ